MPKSDFEQVVRRFKETLKARTGQEKYQSWFGSLEVESYVNGVLSCSVATPFLKRWISDQFDPLLRECAASVLTGFKRIEITARPGVNSVAKGITVNPARDPNASTTSTPPLGQPGLRAPTNRPSSPGAWAQVPRTPTGAGGFEGSPLDPYCTFENLVTGDSNRLAQAAARQLASCVGGDRSTFSKLPFNPLHVHAGVGHGKTHLLQAIAWDVKQRLPEAQVLYLTAERFRFHFVGALKSADPLSFKDRFRQIDILLIDDLEFLTGPKTELEFEHIINSLIDAGKPVVVAAAHPPSQIDQLNERMRGRLQRGLVVEIQPLDKELRREVLVRRVNDKRKADPGFNVPAEVIDLLATSLTESARELEGAVTRLMASHQLMRMPITLELTEQIIRDLTQSGDQPKIKIEDIIRVVSKHFGVPKVELLSQRRHKSVVWPRQIGMFLVKQMTQRSLPEIGRRFGNRDHTTVLHAIRRIEGELEGNPKLRDELEELKKLLKH